MKHNNMFAINITLKTFPTFEGERVVVTDNYLLMNALCYTECITWIIYMPG